MQDYLISYQFKVSNSDASGFGENRFSTDAKMNFELLEERREYIKNHLQENGVQNPNIVILNIVKMD